MVKKEASRLNVTMSETLPAAQQSEVDALSASGDFDASFARDEAAGHAKVIADAEAAKKNVTDKDVKKLIGKLLPKLHKHEKDAERLEKIAKS
jgi:predicted outer membrane protein